MGQKRLRATDLCLSWHKPNTHHLK